MSGIVQIVAVLVSGALLLLVLELVRRRKLTEEHSFIWLVCAFVLLAMSVWRESLHLIAEWLGIFYPPMVLLLMLIFEFASVISVTSSPSSFYGGIYRTCHIELILPCDQSLLSAVQRCSLRNTIPSVRRMSLSHTGEVNNRSGKVHIR